MLASDCCRLECILEALRRLWPMALDRCGLVLVFRLFVGLGSLSLWPLDLSLRDWLGLGSRHLLGSVLGQLALFFVILWLGSASSRRFFRRGARLLSSQRRGGDRL